MSCLNLRGRDVDQAVVQESLEGKQHLSLTQRTDFHDGVHVPRPVEPGENEPLARIELDLYERIERRLAVTPWEIFTANEKIELDLEKELRRLRHKIDVRYRSRSLKLRCSDATVRERAEVGCDESGKPVRMVATIQQRRTNTAGSSCRDFAGTRGPC